LTFLLLCVFFFCHFLPPLTHIFRQAKFAFPLNQNQTYTHTYSYKLNFWDVGGQTTIRSYWRNYFEQTDGVIWVVDSGDRIRLQDTKEELHNLLLQEKLAGATLLVFCNKQDIEGSLTMAEIREILDLDGIKTRHWGSIGCSAVTGEGLLEGIDWIVTDIASRIFMLE